MSPHKISPFDLSVTLICYIVCYSFILTIHLFVWNFLKKYCCIFCEEFFASYVRVPLSSVCFSWDIWGVLTELLSVEWNVVRMKVTPETSGDVLSVLALCQWLTSIPERVTIVIDAPVFKVVLNCFILRSMPWTFPSHLREQRGHWNWAFIYRYLMIICNNYL